MDELYSEFESILESMNIEIDVEIEGDEMISDKFDRYDTEKTTEFFENIEANYSVDILSFGQIHSGSSFQELKEYIEENQ